MRCASSYAVCLNSLETGHLEQVRQMAQVMLEQAPPGRLTDASRGGRTTFSVWCTIAGMNWTPPRSILQRLVDKRYVVHTQAARNGMIGLVRVHLAGAEISAAWQMMELLSQLDLDRMGQEGDDARSLRAQLAYLQGDAETAFRWADAYTTPVPDRLLTWLQDPHLAKAQHPPGERHGRRMCSRRLTSWTR